MTRDQDLWASTFTPTRSLVRLFIHSFTTLANSFIYVFIYLFDLFIETGFHCVAQAILVLTILLLQPPEAKITNMCNFVLHAPTSHLGNALTST